MTVVDARLFNVQAM
ncbi:hypothetical protein RSAG8_13282, partial [Rhizoctonia solani AG-8 WAC10335]